MCRSWGLLTDHVVLTVTKYWLRVQLLTVKLVNSDLLITSVMGLPVFGVDLYYLRFTPPSWAVYQLYTSSWYSPLY